MSKFIRVFACLFTLGFMGSAYAAGYTCDSYKKYTSCNTGYYMTKGGTYNATAQVGNACTACPSGCTCGGGTANKVCSVTISYNLNGGSGTTPSATTCTPGSSCTLASISATTFYKAGYKLAGWASTTTGTAVTSITAPTSNATYYAIWTACTAGTYHAAATGTAANTCAACSDATQYQNETGQSSCKNVDTGYYKSSNSAQTQCPANYRSGAGASSQAGCKASCAAGTRVVTANAACTSPAGGWWTAAHTVSYGNISPVNYCMTGYNSTGTAATNHDAKTDCTRTISGGQYVPANTIPVRYIKWASGGSTANSGTHMVEIQAFASSDGTGTNLLSGKTGTGGSNITKATDGSWARSGYADGSTTLDIGSVQNIGSIKFAPYTDGRTYYNYGISVSSDNSNWIQVFFVDNLPTQNSATAVGELIVLAGAPTSCAAGTAKAAATLTLGTTSSCSTCTAGTYSGAGASSCTAADKGYHVPSAGASSQTKCAAGKYTSSTGQSSCANVSAGYYSNGGGTSATPTAAGNGCLTGQSCGKCAAGTYSAAGAGSCSNVSAGYYSNGGGTSATPTAAGNGCLTGQSCGKCAAGTYSAAGAGSCSNITAGYYSNGGGTSATPTAAGNGCLTGQSCGKCAAGTYSAAGAASCTAADKGYHVPSAGSSSQTKCEAGKYQDTTGQSSCKSCPTLTTGYSYTSDTGLTAVTSCTETKSYSAVNSTYCYGGQLTKVATSTSAWGTATSSLTAKAGAHISGTGDNTTCAACGAGTYQGSNGSTATSCTTCAAGTYNTTSGNSSCTACPAGKYCTGGQNNTNCAAGTYRSATGGKAASDCSSCPTLTTGYSYTSTTGLTAVTSCTETKAASSVNSTYCYGGQLTKVATSTTAWGTATSTLTAKAGAHISGSGDSTTCAACGAGTYQGTNGSNATSCTTCAAGTYNTTTGNSSCTTCPAGKYCTGGTNNTNCPAGTYRSSTGGTAATSCSSCPTLTSGYSYASTTGMTAVTQCTETKAYSSVSGNCYSGALTKTAKDASTWNTATSTLTAKAGSILSGSGDSATCSQCSGAVYSAGGSATSCTACPNQTSGWTRGTGSGWTSYSSCYETQTPANCASGSVKHTASSATAWNSAVTLVTTLKSNAGYYASTTATSCTICPVGKYCAAGATAGTDASKGYYVASTGQSTQIACAAGKYQDATGQSSCKSCPDLTTGYSYTSTTGMTAVTSCTETKAASSVNSTYCYGGQLTKVATSTTAWGTATSTLTAKAGAHISGSGDSTTCAACGAGTYQGTNGSNATSCTTCAAGTYNTTTGNSSCTTCPAGKYCTGGQNNTNCEAGTYRSATGGAAASDCSACSALSGVSPSGGTYTSAAGSTANTACKYTAPTKTITGCSTVTSNQVTYSGSAWPASTYNVSAAGGYVIANNGTASATCTKCNAGTYSAGGSAISCSNCTGRNSFSDAGASSCTTVSNGYYSTGCNTSNNNCTGQSQCGSGTWCASGVQNNCSSLTGVSVSGGSYSSAAGSTANTACKYTAPNKTITGCSAVTTNTVTYSGTAWPATTYNVSASGGYVIANNGTATATCSQCSGATFSAGGSATTCTACPAQTSGWTRNTGTGWSAVTQCNQTKTGSAINANCSAGVLTQNATSTSAWGETKITTALQANAGSIVSGQTCQQCSGAKYSAGGTATTCTDCPTVTSGYTLGTGTGWTGYGSCYETKAYGSVSANCASGQLKKVATSASAWGTATSTLTAKAGSILSGSGDSATCTQCSGAVFSAGGSATSCTACPDQTSGWTRNTGTGWSAVTQCNQTRKPANCASGSTIQYGKTATTWDAEQINAALSSNPGYYVSGLTCQQCGKGTFYGGGTATSCSSCPSAETGWAWTNDVGLSAVTQCTETTTPSVASSPIASICTAGTLTKKATNATTWGTATASGLTAKAGRYVDGTTCSACAAGTYTASATTATSCTAASKGYYVSGAEKTGQTACAAGTYTSSTGQSSCANAVAGTYTTGCGGANNTACTGTAVCAASTYSDANASSCTACTTAKGYANSGANAADHAGLESCKVTCGGGSYVATAGAGCTNVTAGYWSAGGTANEKNGTTARTACASGLTTIGYGAGADEAGDCGHVLHVGSNTLYLRSTKKTTPSLNVKVGGTTFYGNMSTATKGKVRVSKDGTTYSVHDDSM